MATKTAQAQEQETETQSQDGPVLDMSDAAVKKLIKTAKQRGFVTYDELNEVLPSEEVSSEQIEDTMSMLSDMGINVIDSDDAEEAAEEVKALNEAELAARARGDVFEDEEVAPEDDDEILVAALGGAAAGAVEDVKDAVAPAMVVGEIVVETTRPRGPRPPTGSHLVI